MAFLDILTDSDPLQPRSGHSQTRLNGKSPAKALSRALHTPGAWAPQ